MRYDYIANGIVNILSQLTDPANTAKKAFGKCKIYEGEFESPDRSPEDYNPLTTYCLVEPRGTQYKLAGSNSIKDLLAEPQIIIFIGSDTSSRGNAAQDVYERLDLVHKALNGTAIYNGNENIGMTLLMGGSDAKEFGRPNHACWSLSVIFRTQIHIG